MLFLPHFGCCISSPSGFHIFSTSLYVQVDVTDLPNCTIKMKVSFRGNSVEYDNVEFESMPCTSITTEVLLITMLHASLLLNALQIGPKWILSDLFIRIFIHSDNADHQSRRYSASYYD